MARSRAEEKKEDFLPFPINSFSDGSIEIPEEAHPPTAEKKEGIPSNALDSDYSVPYVHHLSKIVSGSLCSLYANSEGRGKRKTKCDDAFAVHFESDYPFVFIADGGFGSCDPEHIKQISADPEIKKL